MSSIPDMLIRIKNAQRAGHETVHIPYSKFKHEIAKTLERTKFVGGVERKGKRVKKTLAIALLYKDGEPLIHEVKLISLPSRRLYASYQDLHKARHGGIILISTPKGVLSGEEARKTKAGGELIAEIW